MQKEKIANQRLFDLVRHQRGELHHEGLITDEEYALLVDGDGDNVARLESYDLIRAELVRMRAKVAALEKKHRKILAICESERDEDEAKVSLAAMFSRQALKSVDTEEVIEPETA